MARRIGVLLNPTSGKGRVRRHRDAVLAALSGRGDEVVTIQGADAEQAAAVLADRAAEGLDVLVAVGGDGTVHQALQAVAGTDTALGIIPLGTGNDAATSVGIPPLLEQATGVVLDGHTRTFDVGVARTADGQPRYFLCVLSTGFDSILAFGSSEG